MCRIGLSADFLYDEPEHVVVGVGVLECLTDAVAEFDIPQGASGLFASQHAEIDRGNVERDARRAAASMRRHLLETAPT